MKSWDAMKHDHPELGNLEDEARAAGRAGKPWFPTWCSLADRLGEIFEVGRGTAQGAKDFERSRNELLWCWGAFDEISPAPWCQPDPLPIPPSLGSLN